MTPFPAYLGSFDFTSLSLDFFCLSGLWSEKNEEDSLLEDWLLDGSELPKEESLEEGDTSCLGFFDFACLG